MGGFYGSTQVRTDDRDAVLSAAEAVAAAMTIKCFVGPVLNGWVGVYPEGGGQDPSVGVTLAQRLPGDVFHVLVHGDDVFCYWYWQDGQQRDHYNSNPGYFSDDEPAPQPQSATGNPAAYAHLLSGGTTKMAALLAATDVGFESERITEFGKLLGMRNLVAAYEYLKFGDAYGVTGVREFVEVPRVAVADKRAETAARRAALKQEKAALRASGHLLVERELKGRGCLFYPAGTGALMELAGVGPNPTEYQWLPTLVDDPQAVTSTDLGHVVATGVQLAVISNDRLEVKTSPDSQTLWSVPASVGAAAFSPDGKWLVAAGEDGIQVFEAASGAVVGESGGAPHLLFIRHLAIHPSGEWVAVASSSLAVGRIHSGSHWRTYFPGGRHEALPLTPVPQTPEEIEAQFEVAAAQTLKRLKLDGSSPKVVEVREKLQATWAEQKAQALEAARNPPPQTAMEGGSVETIADIGWTADGRWFWLATDSGLRLYDWPALRDSADGDLPPPVATHDTFSVDAWGNKCGGYVYAVVEDRAGHALLYTGLKGMVWRMDLTTRAISELLRIPEQAAGFTLILSDDGEHLGVFALPGYLDANGNPAKQRQVWSVWSYPKLLHTAAAG